MSTEIFFSINCPECNETIKHDVLLSDWLLIDGKKLEINIFHFERTDWTCPNCKEEFTIGDIEIWNKKDL